MAWDPWPFLQDGRRHRRKPVGSCPGVRAWEGELWDFLGREDFVVSASEGGPNSGQCWVDVVPVFFLNMPCSSGFTDGASSDLLGLGCP